ncbi:exopolysaccharide biosynthesis protein [Candidatus Gracilibacteria bacterium]|nr:exopolysaccharide biosynthesis protein [Candidatus Gracilibacteria bacterium]NJP18809.1 exopolysaccharide biosynthesis protein [Hydrococcus sp. CRU_1_1]
MSHSVSTKLHTSKLLLDILQQHQEEKIALKDILRGMGDRAFGPALLICAIPEVLPIPVVGVSAIIGIPLMLVSGQLFLGFKRVWLPQWIGNFSFERKFLEKAILKILHYLKKLERIIKPRWQFMSFPIVNRLLGLLLLVLGVVIALPNPLLSLSEN